jgi:LCP family protein required for cell wall assembly
MNAHAYTSPALSRLNPTLARRQPQALAKPTRAQSVVELVLFAVFGVSIILSAIALYSMYSPAHKSVPNRVADGLRSGRVNVLIIGTSGKGRSVSTHSVTLLSVQPRAGGVAMISLPRDLWVRVSHYGSHRLASAWNIGDSSGYPGEGAGLVSDTVENTIGQPVHAYLRIDTADLRRTIDDLGGIDLVVAHPFYERAKGDRFREGPVHLTGERAVRFAQSNQVSGPQGTRHARELRQQQVIAAVLVKLTGATEETRTKLARSGRITTSSTNLTTEQIDELSAMMRAKPIRNVTLEPLVTQFEVRSFFDAGLAVRPAGGDYSKMRALARNVFAGAQPLASVH